MRRDTLAGAASAVPSRPRRWISGLTPLVLTISVVQALASLAIATLMLGFWRTHHRESLRLWGWSWMALAVHQVSAALAFQLTTTFENPGHPWRVAAASVALAASGWHLYWFLRGGMCLLRPSRSDRGKATFTLVAVALAGVVIAAGTVNAGVDVRRLLRAGLPLAGDAGVFAAVGLVVLRRRAGMPRLGVRVLSASALAYALVRALYLAAFIYEMRFNISTKVGEYGGVISLVLQILLAMGIVVWMLDDERAAVARTSAALASSEARFRRLVDHARLVAWEFDSLTKRFTFVSPQAQRLLGYSPEEWREPNFWFDHVHPDDRDRARAFSHEQSRLGQEHAFEYRMIRKDGGVVWVRDLTTVDQRDGQIIGLRGVLIDVSDRKAAERDTQDIQQRLTTVVSAAPVVVWAVDLAGIVTLSEGHGLEDLGLRPGEVVGRSMAELYPDSPQIIDNHRRALNGETVLDTVDVRGRVFESRLAPLVGSDGAINGAIGVAIDVTQRHSAQDALRRSEEQSRLLFESAIDPVFDWDIVADRATFSPSWRRLIGCPETTADPPTWESRLHPDDRQHVLRRLNESLQNDSAPYEIEYRIRAAGGEWKWVLSRGRVVSRDAQGRALRMVGSITDITERKQAETALRESEARLRAMIDNAPSVAIQGFDVHGRVLFWNRAAESIFGWSEAEAVGRTLDMLMFDDDCQEAFMHALREIDRSGESATLGDLPFRRRDGAAGWCYSTLLKLPGAPSSTFVCMDVDVTAHKRAEQALERSNNLQQLLLSELDHRVRNNLASLSALIDISARDSTSVRDLAASVRSRVQAMSVVHAMLSREHWRAVDLRQLFLTLAPVGAQERMVIDGPTVSIAARQATALGMVLQELFANSQKHGALRVPGGAIAVMWTLAAAHSGASERMLWLHWRESGGPEIVPPVRDGVGTGLIHGLVRTELRGEASLTFDRDGATHRFSLVLDGADPVTAMPAPRQVAVATI